MEDMRTRGEQQFDAEQEHLWSQLQADKEHERRMADERMRSI